MCLFVSGGNCVFVYPPPIPARRGSVSRDSSGVEGVIFYMI